MTPGSSLKCAPTQDVSHQSGAKWNFRGAQAETQEEWNREEHSYYIKRDMNKRQRCNKTI